MCWTRDGVIDFPACWLRNSIEVRDSTGPSAPASPSLLPSVKSYQA